MLRNVIASFWALLLLVSAAHAQFQFFEHMFGGGGHQQQQHQHQQDQQNVPSDSSWYQRSWEGGTSESSLSINEARLTLNSTLQQISMPWHSCLRALPTPLPVPAS